MPAINSSQVPTVAPGDLFETFTGDTSLNIRWITATDPVYYEVANRPVADVVVRQLILAKAIDALNVSLNHAAIYPYVVQPQVGSFTESVDVPIGFIWDLHLSLPKKWRNVRLAKIKRLSGSNDDTAGYTGKLRVIFTADQEGTTVETAIFYADYTINTTLTFQPMALTVVPNGDESLVLSTTETSSVSGYITFKTLDVDAVATQAFYGALLPPDDLTVDTSGLYVDPAAYEIVDFIPSGSGDYSNVAVSHGTGRLVDSAWNSIPPLDSDIQSWLEAFNYPFDAIANLTSTDGLVIPTGLFREFDITVPAGDEPIDDATGTYFPVYISRIEKIGNAGGAMRLHFATHNVTQATPSLAPIEFATLDLTDTMIVGELVPIAPSSNLFLQTGGAASSYLQGFGRGHVVLSSAWSGSDDVITSFFADVDALTGTPADTEFTQSSTRISSFGLSRVPQYAPTAGQSAALVGTTTRFTPSLEPADDNRFVNELDQGLGALVDLEAQTGILPHNAITRAAYTGGICHRVVKMIMDNNKVPSGDSTFYDLYVLPRLRILYGRDPAFGDYWFDGSRLLFFTGDAWLG